MEMVQQEMRETSSDFLTHIQQEAICDKFSSVSLSRQAHQKEVPMIHGILQIKRNKQLPQQKQIFKFRASLPPAFLKKSKRWRCQI